jgi:hypothetical protein
MTKQLSIRVVLALLLGFALMVSACKEDPPVPIEELGTLEITIDGLPMGTDAQVEVTGPENYSKTLTASETLSDLPVGTYTITVGEVDANGIDYVVGDDDAMQDAVVSKDQTTSVSITYDTKGNVFGIRGKWQSSGTNVAPLLVALFGTDSIYAEFNADNTYLVEQYDTTGASITLSGTYTQEKSGVGNIWNITVIQSSPTPLTSEGIFEVDESAAPVTMQYEIAQTQPDIGATPPTAADGFGSTSSGAVGTANIQNYVRIE